MDHLIYPPSTVYEAAAAGTALVPQKRSYAAIDSSGVDTGPAETGSSLFYGVSYNFFGNTFVLSKSRTWTKVYDPASQGLLTRVPETTATEIQDAVSAAVAAQPTLASVSPSSRRRMLLNLISVFRQNGPRIRHTLCVEVGKTLAEADAEFERGLDSLENACSLANEFSGVHHVNQASETYTIEEALGVCLTISPFNFPFMIPLWSIPYAIMAGNTVILKPSERAPSISQVMAECFLQAGFSPGVFNVVHGGPSVVTGLISQPSIRAVSFVGSSEAGERVYDHAKATRKRVQVEGNGKNHGVVLDDADRKKVLYAIAGSAFGAAGQRCMAVSVVVFVGSTREWIDDLVQVAKTLIIGCGLDPLVEVGPLITAAAKRRVEDIIDGAEKDGAKIVLDGRNYVVPDYPNGNFIGPTILRGVQPYMKCYQEEIFGPVLCCIEVDTLEQAIDLVNDNRFGNGCTLFTNRPSSARTFQHAVNVGQIGINVPVIAPSGPVLRTANKDSFMGDINIQGRGAGKFFTMTKTVTSLWF